MALSAGFSNQKQPSTIVGQGEGTPTHDGSVDSKENSCKINQKKTKIHPPQLKIGNNGNFLFIMLSRTIQKDSQHNPKTDSTEDGVNESEGDGVGSSRGVFFVLGAAAMVVVVVEQKETGK